MHLHHKLRPSARALLSAFVLAAAFGLSACDGGSSTAQTVSTTPPPPPPAPPPPSPPPPSPPPPGNSTLIYNSALAITGAGVVPRGVEIGPDGTVITVGSFDAGAPITAGSLSATSGDSQADIFILFQDSNGAPRQLTAFGGGGGPDFAADVAIAEDGSIYVTGAIAGTARFGSLTAATGSPANGDAFVVKLSPSGTPQWVLRGAGSAPGLGNEIEIASNGDLVVTGTFQQSLDFGQGVQINSSQSVDQAYVLRVSPNGQPIWARAITGPVTVGGRGVAADPISLEGDNDRRVFAAVQFNGGSATLETPSGNLSVTGPGGGGDCMIIALSADGAPLFTRSFGGAGFDNCRGIGATFNGDIVFAGEFSGTVDFDQRQVTSVGSEDIYVVRLNRAGEVQSALSAGGAGNDGGPEIEVDENGRSFFTGSFFGPAMVSTGETFDSCGAPREVFIGEVPPDGSGVTFAEPAPGTGDDVAFALGLGPNETLALVGTYTGTLQFGATTPLTVSGQNSTCVALASRQSANPPPPTQSFITAGPASFPQMRYRADGALQSASVPIYLYAPSTPGRYPLIVWSHGGIASPQNIELMEFRATQGYIVAAPAHADSAELRGSGASSGLAGTGDTFSFVNRAADCSLALDVVSTLEAALPSGFQIDASRPTIGGHSFGAFTAMELAGADWSRQPDGRTGTPLTSDDAFSTQVIPDGLVPDPRFVAGLFVSPAGNEQDFGLVNFNSVDIPFLAITGTRDLGPPNAPFPSGFIDRRDVFSSSANDGIGADDGVNDDGQYFIVFDNATHFDFLGNNNTYDPEVREVVTRFVNGVVRSDAAAIAPINTPSQYRAGRPLIFDFLARPYVP